MGAKRMFTDDQIREIRASKATRTEIAEQYGCCKRMVWQIKSGAIYDDVEGPPANPCSIVREPVPNRKLTIEQVKNLRDQRGKLTLKEMAAITGASTTCCHLASMGHTYKEVQ